jgi:hypothetical protein
MRLGLFFKDIGCFLRDKYFEQQDTRGDILCDWSTLRLTTFGVSLILSFLSLVLLIVSEYTWGYWWVMFIVFPLHIIAELIPPIVKFFIKLYPKLRIRYLVPHKDMPLYINDEDEEVRDIAKGFLKKEI